MGFIKFWAFIWILLIGSTVYADSSSINIAKQKKEAIEKLKARRAGFEKFLERRNRRKQRRLRRADDQKKVRRAYALKRENARKSFERVEDDFPYKDYRRFLQQREKHREKIEKARSEFGKMSKELDKIYENEKYKIDGNKEYEL